MPNRPKKLCTYPGCNTLVDGSESKCAVHRTEYKKSLSKKRIRPEYDKWYNTSLWANIRKRKLGEEPLCQECLKYDEYVTANIVDHIIPHKGLWNIFVDYDNLQSLCKSCHDRKTAKEDGTFNKVQYFPTDIRKPNCPVIVVCGPSGAGKSYYVEQNKKDNDLVIDVDLIISELSNLPIYHNTNQYLNLALIQRNEILRNLYRCNNNRVWFITTAAKIKHRNHWRNILKAKVVVMETPVNFCINRIKNDNRRQDVQQTIDRVSKWWINYERSQEDIIIRV